MKPTLTLLILLTLIPLNAFAQDSLQRDLPDNALARLGKGAISGNIDYSPDGSRLAVASSIGIYVYDTTTYEAVFLLSGHSAEVTSVAFSLDGNTIASGDGNWEDNNLRLWDAETGEEKLALSGGFLEFGSIAFSPDGRTLASSHKSLGVGHSERDGIVRLWDAATGDLRATISVGIRRPTSLAFSPDGGTLAVGKLDWAFGFGSWGSVSLWEAETLEFIRTLGTHPRGAGLDYGVECVAFSADGSTLAVGRAIDEWYRFARSTLRLWDVNTGEKFAC